MENPDVDTISKEMDLARAEVGRKFAAIFSGDGFWDLSREQLETIFEVIRHTKDAYDLSRVFLQECRDAKD